MKDSDTDTWYSRESDEHTAYCTNLFYFLSKLFVPQYILIQYDKQKIQIAEKLILYEFLQLSRYLHIKAIWFRLFSHQTWFKGIFSYFVWFSSINGLLFWIIVAGVLPFIMKKIPMYSLFRHVNRAQHMGHIFIYQEFLLLQINQVHELTFLFIR
jgi:hypothetical protein